MIRPYVSVLIGAPLMLAVGVAYALLPSAWDGQLVWSAVGVGAFGWAFALGLRGPFLLVLKRATTDIPQLSRRMTALSGPLEEVVRLLAVVLIGRDLDTAYSIGLGWAGIEIVYAILNGALLTSLQARTDEKGVEAREQLEAFGMLRDFPALASVVERITASGFHIGATLLLATWPLVALVTIPLHSALNLGFTSMLKRNLFYAQVVVAAIGIPTLILGLLASDAI